MSLTLQAKLVATYLIVMLVLFFWGIATESNKTRDNIGKVLFGMTVVMIFGWVVAMWIEA